MGDYGSQPDTRNWQYPTASQVITGVNLNWGGASPATGISPTWFAAYLTFYLEITVAGSYTFR